MPTYQITSAVHALGYKPEQYRRTIIVHLTEKQTKALIWQYPGEGLSPMQTRIIEDALRAGAEHARYNSTIASCTMVAAKDCYGSFRANKWLGDILA